PTNPPLYPGAYAPLSWPIPATGYPLAAPGPTFYPAGAPVDFPSAILANPAALPKGEFGGDWRSVLVRDFPQLYNRKLTEYPLVATGGQLNPADPQLAQAIQERQTMAKEIYDRLVKVTGALDPNQPANQAVLPTQPEFQAARWLAQLAVN